MRYETCECIKGRYVCKKCNEDPFSITRGQLQELRECIESTVGGDYASKQALEIIARVIGKYA
jgi:hypothetical protein